MFCIVEENFMNFDEAIKVHVEWRTKLKIYLTNPDHSLDPSVVGMDNYCSLGQWLYGLGKCYSGTSEYQNLITEHAKFHSIAAKIVSKAKSRFNLTEEISFGNQSEFGKSSAKIIELIIAMKNKIGL